MQQTRGTSDKFRLSRIIAIHVLEIFRQGLPSSACSRAAWGAALQRHTSGKTHSTEVMGLQPLTQKAILPLPLPRSTNTLSAATQNDSEIKFVVVLFK